MINSNASGAANLQIPVNGTGISLSLDTPALSVSRSGNNAVLSWPPVSNATAYQVWSASDPFGAFTLLTPTALTTPGYTDTRGLSRAFYKVVALRD